MAVQDDNSLGGEATLAGQREARPQRADVSLGDERTLGGGDAAGLDTVIDDIEVVDLQARYKIEGTLGQGGMGAVLLATDTRLDRKVAIKRILGEAARSKTAIMRFLTEAKAIAALNHPNVVQIYDYGRAKDGPFLIMEYVDGGSVADRCKQGALPLDETVSLACQICDGLAKAHDAGIVHRDIKPANVLLNRDGLPKLTDFGLAKANMADHGMTITGAVMGTPDFMPPEQRRDAAEVDHRSDLWSLAATVYQMVTGRSPKIIRFNDIPAALQEVLAKALEENKEARYQSAREFRDAIKATIHTTAPMAGTLNEGQCPTCGTQNDAQRKFCRGCGGSLEAPCLSCVKPMPMWEEICGQCGAKQKPLIESRRSEMSSRQEQAQGLLKDNEFDQAENLAVALRDEADPRLKQLVGWATRFLAEVATARDMQLAQAVERLSEALKHEASYDYQAAVNALEMVPASLRQRTLAGHSASLAEALVRLKAKRDEARRLEIRIKNRITSRDLGGLLEEVERFRNLRPDRKDVETLALQLRDRQEKLVTQRNEAVGLATACLDAKDYEGVRTALRKVDASVESPDVERLRLAADSAIQRFNGLVREIREAVTHKQFEGLLERVDLGLDIKPGHAEFLKLRESLLAREGKIVAGIDELVSQGEAAFQLCDFGKATATLQRIPEARRTEEVATRLEASEHLGMLRAGLAGAIERFSRVTDLATEEVGVLAGAARDGRNYLGAIAAYGLKEASIEEWCEKWESAAAKRQAADDASLGIREALDDIMTGGGTALRALGRGVAGLVNRSQDSGLAVEKLKVAAAVVFAAVISAGAAAGLFFWFAGAWQARTLTNDVGMQLARIPAGEYYRKIKRVASDRNQKDLFIRSKVRIPEPFYIGCTEVTQQQWEAIMDTRPWQGQPKTIDRDEQPVTYVTRAEAEEFCRLLTQHERSKGRLPQGEEYRLPTEEEWEFAARAGSYSVFYAGDSPDAVNPYEWCETTCSDGQRDHPRDVGLKSPTKWGLHDAFGNVREICKDWVRGGCWTEPPERCAISRNNNNSPPDGNELTGFRVLLGKKL